MMRPETVQVSLPRRDRACDTQTDDMREILAQARPDQIRRLMDDIRDGGPVEDPRGTA